MQQYAWWFLNLHHMKGYLLLLTGFLMVMVGCEPDKTGKIQEKINLLSEKAVPDKRVGVFDIAVIKGQGNSLVLKGELLSASLKDSVVKIARGFHGQITDSITILPDTLTLKKNWGLVTVSVANLRKLPAHSAEMVSQAVLGTPVRILKKKGGWFFVQTPDHYLAWTNTSSVEPLDREEFDKWKTAERLIFTGNNGLIIKESGNQEIVSDLVMGSLVVKLAETAREYRIILPDKREGITGKENFTDFNLWKNSRQITCENLAATAKKLLGLPYMWGGTSSKALDCSGFTRNVFFMNGIILERDASQQYKYGEAVDPGEDFSNLMPCDLLFFGRKDPVRIVHVGLYLGNKKVINSSGWVQINSLDKNQPDYSDYLFSTFVCAKRLSGLKPQFGYLPVKEHPWY